MNRTSEQKIEGRDLWKVFGPHPQRVVAEWDSYAEGISKTELLKKTGCVVGVREASFSIREGETFVLMGLSGSGKSTLLRLLNRLHEPTRGKVFIDGWEVTALKAPKLRALRRSKTGMVFQSFALLPHRRVIDNVAFGLEVQGWDREKRRHRALEVLELVGLKGWEQSFIGELSGGMKQRVGLARALAPDPEILLLDEAFSALDPLIRRQMQAEFIKLVSIVKKTIVFVTHDLPEALKLADRIAVMKFGQIVQMGTPEEIILNPKTDYVADFVSDLPKMQFIPASSVMLDPKKWLVPADTPVADILARMDHENLWYAFLTAENGRLLGAVYYRTLLKRADKNRPAEKEDIITRYPAAELNTLLEDLPRIAAKSKIPIAVTNGDKRALGFIPREHLLHALSNQDARSPEKEEA